MLVPACNRQVGEHPFHIAGKKYVDAVRLARDLGYTRVTIATNGALIGTGTVDGTVTVAPVTPVAAHESPRKSGRAVSRRME